MNNGEQNNSSMGGTGYLVVRVSTANGAIPITGAFVSVRGSDPENSDFYTSVYSGASGLTEKIALPAPPRAMSESPGNTRPFSVYSIDVFADGYTDLFFVNVPIFDTVTSIQPANMIPKSDNRYTDSFAPYESTLRETENTEL